MAEAVIPEEEKVMRDKDKVNLILDGGTMTVLGTGAGNARAIGGPDAQSEIKDVVTKQPDVSGLKGRAWLADFDAGRRLMGVRPEDDAGLAHWVVEAPWAHPIWHSYSIILIHLRPMPDSRPTKFHVDGATHEMHVYALDPNKDRNRMIENGIPEGHWMSPVNFAAQFIEISDELALARIRSCIDMICDGTLSPDTDWMSDWVKLFNDKMIKKEWR